MYTKKVIEYRLDGDRPVKLEVPVNAVFAAVHVRENFPHVVAVVPTATNITKFIEIITVLANREFGELGQSYIYIGNFKMMRKVAENAPPEDFSLHVLYREVSNEEMLNAASSQPVSSPILSK